MRVRYTECEGLSSFAACAVLETLASQIPQDECIVESGVFRGRSLLALAEGSEDGYKARVFGVDPLNTPRPSKPKYASDATYAYLLKVIDGWPISLIKGYSVTTAARWTGPKVGLLHIDSDHRYQPVLDEVSAWAPHLAHDAVVCFDDYDVATFPGVVRAVDELVASGKLDDFWMATDRLAVTRWLG